MVYNPKVSVEVNLNKIVYAHHWVMALDWLNSLCPSLGYGARLAN